MSLAVDANPRKSKRHASKSPSRTSHCRQRANFVKNAGEKVGRAFKVLSACALAFAFLIPAGPAQASNAAPNGKSGAGYWTVSGDGTVVPFGDAKDLGLLPRRPNGRIVGIAAQPG